MLPTHPITEGPPVSKAGAGCARLFGVPFLLAGLFFFYGIFIRPVAEMWRARTWVSVPCQVLSSRVQAGRNSEGNARHHAVITYRYTFAGQTFTSDRYRFTAFSNSDSSRRKAQALVQAHKPGATLPCFVNPAQPSEAVLLRGPTWELLWGLFPIPFILVGGALVFMSGRSLKPKVAPSPADPALELAALTGEKELRPQESAWGRFLGVLLFALLWNGVVAALFAAKASGKSPPWFFLAIFGAVGLLLIGATIYQALRFLTPRIRLVVNSLAVPLGGTLQVQWDFPGGARGLRSLKLEVEAAEVTTYRRGTDTRTDRFPFYQAVLVDTRDFSSRPAGYAETVVPPGLVPSFKSKNNQIEWILRVRGQVAGRPDLHETFAFVVVPRL